MCLPETTNEIQANAIENQMEESISDWLSCEGLPEMNDDGRPGGDQTSSSNSVHDPPPSDEVMARLQSSFDQTTRLMLAIKKAAQELMKCVSVSQSGRDMVKRGQDLAKALQAPIDDIDELLVIPRETMKTSEAMCMCQCVVDNIGNEGRC